MGKFKKIIYSLGLAITCVSLVGCEEKQPSSSETPSSEISSSSNSSSSSSSSSSTDVENPDVELEEVTVKADLLGCAEQLGEKVKPTEDFVWGRFTFSPGVYFESNSSSNGPCINTQNKEHAIKFTLAGPGSVSFDFKNAGAKNFKLVLTKDGEICQETEEFTKEETTAIAPFEFKDLEAGTYTLYSSGQSIRIWNLQFTEKVAKGEVTGIEIQTEGTKEFLQGQEFNNNGLNVFKVYSNGRKDALTLSDLEIDSTAFNPNEAGEYEIIVRLKDTEFEAYYKVSVFQAESIVMYDYTLSSSRITQPLQRVFLKDSEFNANNLVVKALAKSKDGTKQREFVLDSSAYTLSTVDLTTTGTKTVEISYNNLKTSYDIHVVENVLTDENAIIRVDANATEVGVINHESYGQIAQFKSINDAVKYLELSNVKNSTRKTIYLADGTYEEKVEINIPNISLLGESQDKSKVIITYDALAGITDATGKMGHSTDGSATMSVRSSASGFIGKDFTVMNYYNTHERYLESLKITSDSQAVACLVQADKSIFENVKFSSYHDTLYAQINRQYYLNCEIEGRTDYIFGYNATAYFKGCTIRSIGAGVTEKNGGYIVATKGYSSSINEDGINYGYIFDECILTGDENVQAGSVSIARGWGDNMSVMVMNSTIGAQFSKKAFKDDSTDLNYRYSQMNSKPFASLLLEYNNTGEGAILAEETELIEKLKTETCTIVTDATLASKYNDFSEIFGKTNSKVTYLEDWVPFADAEVETYVWGLMFDGGTHESDYVETWKAEDASGKDTYSNKLLNGALLNGTFRNNNSSVQLAQNSTISFKVKKGALVSIKGHDASYGIFDVNGVEMAGSYEFTAEEDMVVVITANTASNSYITQIIVSQDSIVEPMETTTTTSWYFDGTGASSETDFTTTEEIKNAVQEFGALKIDATNGRVSYSGSYYSRFEGEIIITINVLAGDELLINAFSTGYNYTVNGIKADSESFSYKVEQDGVLTIKVEASTTANIRNIKLISPLR